MGLYHHEPWPADEIGKAAIEKLEAAHAASEIEDEPAHVAPFFHGLILALALTAACLIVAHLLARYVL